MFTSRFSFDGRIVLITGGSRGLGLALAREACALGARVALLARDPNELARARDDLRRNGGDALPVECDLLEPAAIEQAVTRIVDHFGGLDVVINKAGMMRTGSHSFAKFKGDYAAEYKRFTAASRLPFASISAERAARKILVACASGRPALVMPLAARLMTIANALFPNLFGRMMKVANGFLPLPTGPGGDEPRRGSEIR